MEKLESKLIIGNIRLAVVGLVILLPLFAIGLFVYFFTTISVYLIVSLILSSILRTPATYLSQTRFYFFRIPRVLAVLISMLAFLGGVIVFVRFFLPMVLAQVQALDSFEKLIANLSPVIDRLEDFLSKSLGIKFLPREIVIKTLENKFNSVFASSNENLGFVLKLLSLSSNFAVGLLAVLFTTFYFLGEKGTFKRYFTSLIPNRFFELGITAIHKIERMLSNYLFGLLIQMIAIFTCLSLGLTIVGVNNALMIALFAAIVNVVPFLGPITGIAFGLLVLLTTAQLPPQELGYLLIRALLVFLATQTADNLIFQPLIFSKSVKAHPLEIFLIIVIGAQVADIIGMILAIPVYTTLKISVVEFLMGYKKYQIFRESS
jgi:predicted PurR-regulated permease PerM